MATLIGSFLVYRNQMAPKHHVGIVQMESAIQANPHYKAYNDAVQQYEHLKMQYEQEQAEHILVERQYHAMKTFSMQDEGINLSLQRIYEAKMNLRRIQLKGQLEGEYRKLVAQYSKELPPQKKVNLEIVNLQLELESLGFYTADEKSQKEQELHELLVESDPSLAANDEWLLKKVAAEMLPKQKAAEEELQQYEKTLVEELKEKGIDHRALTIMAMQKESGFSNTMVWNQTWKIKLEAQKLIVERLHNLIEADIREKVATIAKKENLSIVITKCEYGRETIDITQKVIDLYR